MVPRDLRCLASRQGQEKAWMYNVLPIMKALQSTVTFWTYYTGMLAAGPTIASNNKSRGIFLMNTMRIVYCCWLQVKCQQGCVKASHERKTPSNQSWRSPPKAKPPYRDANFMHEVQGNNEKISQACHCRNSTAWLQR